MAKRVEAILLQGLVDSITFRIADGKADVVVALIGTPQKIAIPGLHKINNCDRFRAICLARPDEEGNYPVVDFIHNDNRQPITDEQRAEQARRVNLRPIYATPNEILVRPVISKITEVELELIAYLQKHPNVLQEMNSDAFEKLIAELMASHGFDVEWTGRNKLTAGDVLAFQTDSLGLTNSYIVECKRFGPDRPVGIEIARALYGAKVDERFSNALLVTTSHFQDGVERFAMNKWDFHTKDFDGLVNWLNRYRPKKGGRLHMQDRRSSRGRYRGKGNRPKGTI